jgi:hypothetical protein
MWVVSAPESSQPSYEELAALVVGLVTRVEVLEAENAELRRRLGMDSTNSSTPPSKDSMGAKAARRADRSSRERSKGRKPGGQPGRKGSGLSPTLTPDRRQTLPPPSQCSGCGGDLSDAADAGMSWAQVWDILPIMLEKVHSLLPRRRCRCGHTTTAAPPFGAVGTVVYGPRVNAAAILLASNGNVPIERSAMLMASLLGTPVSSGFVARSLQRFAQRLATSGFDDAMKTALRDENVLSADETPTTVIPKDTDTHGEPVAGCPHAVTVRTPDARLVYDAPIGSRSQTALAAVGILDGDTGYLVRDDYAGDHLDPALLADLRTRYDTAVAWGITTNRHRTWAQGNHPAYTLATRLAANANQVFTFTRNLALPRTNNPSEQTLTGPKRHQAVSGYWHTLTTLAHYCRIRSYLVSTRNHDIRAIDATHTALTGTPWLPTVSTA